MRKYVHSHVSLQTYVQVDMASVEGFFFSSNSISLKKNIDKLKHSIMNIHEMIE